jgi:hypothetical protein
MKTLTLLAVLVVAATSAHASSPRSIRDVDFRNFSYSTPPTGKCSASTIRLRGGGYEAPEQKVPRDGIGNDCWSVVVAGIEYGDVTGDGREEALVVLYAERGGTEGSNDVFIYTSKNTEPSLLWKFATGDRADGGLRKVYAEEGGLVVELAGKDKLVGGDLYARDGTATGACCPTVFTRTKYRWGRGGFRRKGGAQILPFDGWQ